MSGTLMFLRLTLRERRRRLIGLAAFGLLFMLAGLAARVLTTGEHGHMEMDVLFELGGSTLVSALLLLAWLVGRFAIVASLVLMAGVFSDDRAAGYTRLYAARPRSIIALYGARYLMLSVIAFAMAAVLMPLFDYALLGEWIGWSVFIMITAQVIVFGAVTALFSVMTRADGWAALFVGLLALVWDGLRRIEFFQTSAPFVRETVSVLLPPQGALMRIESAFATRLPMPWDAFLYVVVYGSLVLIIAGIAASRREI
ncbi:hypothetical protein BH23GEM10_BH23GEM10_07640 [soil metagenome]